VLIPCSWPNGCRA